MLVQHSEHISTTRGWGQSVTKDVPAYVCAVEAVCAVRTSIVRGTTNELLLFGAKIQPLAAAAKMSAA